MDPRNTTILYCTAVGRIFAYLVQYCTRYVRYHRAASLLLLYHTYNTPILRSMRHAVVKSRLILIRYEVCMHITRFYYLQQYAHTCLIKSLRILHCCTTTAILLPDIKHTLVSEDPEAEVLIEVDSATHHQRQRKHAAAVFTAAE